jgi:hypothetical protein
MLWPLVRRERNEIFFAHTSFLWSNLATNKATVSCVIVGITAQPKRAARLFDNDAVRDVENISPYLVPTDTVIVAKRPLALSDIGYMQSGNKPTDGGHLLLTGVERDALLQRRPEAARYLKRYVGSKEIINGGHRWCLWVEEADFEEANNLPELSERFHNVRLVRQSSNGSQANENALTPHRFVFAPHNDRPAIAVPNVSSERRQYLPCDLTSYSTVVSNLASVVYDAPLWNLSLIASRMHLVWIATVCGKLETRYRYSNTLGWNTFPVPVLTDQNKLDLTRCAESILLAREAHFPKTIADLYDPDEMPDDLRRAHEDNDEVLERIYIGRRFRNDTERLEKLFDLYAKMIASQPQAKTKKKRSAA